MTKTIFDQLTDYELDDSIELFILGHYEKEILTSSEISERSYIIELTPIMHDFMNLLSCNSLNDYREELIGEIQGWAENNEGISERHLGRELTPWYFEDEDSNDYSSYDHYIQTCFSLAKGFPDDLLWGWIDAETIRRGPKSAVISGGFRIRTTWGEAKEDSKLWGLLDSLGLSVQMDLGSSSVILDSI